MTVARVDRPARTGRRAAASSVHRRGRGEHAGPSRSRPHRLVVDAAAVVDDIDPDGSAALLTRTVHRGFVGLAGACRTAGVSHPWSTALVTRCASASAGSFKHLLVEFDVPTLDTSRTLLPDRRATSRTSRGKRSVRWRIGTMTSPAESVPQPRHLGRVIFCKLLELLKRSAQKISLGRDPGDPSRDLGRHQRGVKPRAQDADGGGQALGVHLARRDVGLETVGLHFRLTDDLEQSQHLLGTDPDHLRRR